MPTIMEGSVVCHSVGAGLSRHSGKFSSIKLYVHKDQGKVFPDTSQVALPGWQPIHS